MTDALLCAGTMIEMPFIDGLAALPKIVRPVDRTLILQSSNVL